MSLTCRESRCTSEATRHVEYRNGGTYVSSHFCAGHATSEAARFERTLGVSTTSRAVDDSCRRGRC